MKLRLHLLKIISVYLHGEGKVKKIFGGALNGVLAPRIGSQIWCSMMGVTQLTFLSRSLIQSSKWEPLRGLLKNQSQEFIVYIKWLKVASWRHQL
jgi:hypothetical protein